VRLPLCAPPASLAAFGGDSAPPPVAGVTYTLQMFTLNDLNEIEPSNEEDVSF
jgi:hypothetical protein